MTKGGQSVTIKIRTQLDFQIAWQSGNQPLIAHQCNFGQMISILLYPTSLALENPHKHAHTSAVTPLHTAVNCTFANLHLKISALSIFVHSSHFLRQIVKPNVLPEALVLCFLCTNHEL